MIRADHIYGKVLSKEDWRTVNLYYRFQLDQIEMATYWDERIVKIKFCDGSLEYFDLHETWRYGVNKNMVDPITSFKMKFANMLKWKLQRGFITQIEFAEKIDVSQATLSRYLNGRTLPQVDTLFLMAETLDMPIEAFTDLYYD